MRQAFKSVPIELHEAARIEGCGWLGILWRVYVPLARPTYLAYALVSVSTHWNNFLWPLIVTNSPETRPLTVGLSIFGAPESGVDISVISAATMMRSEEHTSELQSLMRNSYAVFRLKKKTNTINTEYQQIHKSLTQ